MVFEIEFIVKKKKWNRNIKINCMLIMFSDNFWNLMKRNELNLLKFESYKVLVIYLFLLL